MRYLTSKRPSSNTVKLIYFELLYRYGLQSFTFFIQMANWKMQWKNTILWERCGQSRPFSGCYKVKIENIEVVCNVCVGLRLFIDLGASFPEVLNNFWYPMEINCTMQRELITCQLDQFRSFCNLEIKDVSFDMNFQVFFLNFVANSFWKRWLEVI